MPNPSNIFTPTRTEIRLDYFGQPYQSTVIGRKLPSKAELWEKFKAMQAEHPGTHGGGGISEQKVNQYWEADLIKQENI